MNTHAGHLFVLAMIMNGCSESRALQDKHAVVDQQLRARSTVLLVPGQDGVYGLNPVSREKTRIVTIPLAPQERLYYPVCNQTGTALAVRRSKTLDSQYVIDVFRLTAGKWVPHCTLPPREWVGRHVFLDEERLLCAVRDQNDWEWERIRPVLWNILRREEEHAPREHVQLRTNLLFASPISSEEVLLTTHGPGGPAISLMNTRDGTSKVICEGREPVWIRDKAFAFVRDQTLWRASLDHPNRPCSLAKLTDLGQLLGLSADRSALLVLSTTPSSARDKKGRYYVETIAIDSGERTVLIADEDMEAAYAACSGSWIEVAN